LKLQPCGERAMNIDQTQTPSHPLRRTLLLGAALSWAASLARASDEWTPRLDALLPTRALLLGEQHDASEHQRIARALVQTLADRSALAAVVLEMLPAGSSSAQLPRDSTEAAVQRALGWNEGAWPLAAYGPVVMAAVQAGVPVLGGNLPAQQMRAQMARSELDGRLAPAALAEQQQLMRQGHCGLLPESQIVPMARIQIARDLSLAATLEAAMRQAGPQQLVLMLSGSVHADKRLGVPAHLPPELAVRSVRLLAGGPSGQAGQGSQNEGLFDAHWPTAPAPPTDHCAALREHFRQRPPGPRP
jgi:uncharacterized iron-regulated protein